MDSSDRTEQRLLWFRALRGHLNTHVVSLSTNNGISITPQSLQDSVVIALTSPQSSQSPTATATASPAKTGNNLLPLNSEMVTVERLLGVKRSFRVCLQPQTCGGSVDDDDDGLLVECSFLLVGLLTSGKDGGLHLQDNTGEIPCEVTLPVHCTNCVVLLKEWNLIYSKMHGNYLEIDVLAYVDQGRSLSPQRSLPVGTTFATVADIQRHMKSGKPKSSKCLSMLGRLSAISEPFKNGPEHMLILRIAHTSDSSTFCHLLTQSAGLLHLPRVVKLFEIYTFTELKFVIMNKGKADEAMVLTTTTTTRVECVSSDHASQLLSTPNEPSPSPLSGSSQNSDTVSPPQKRFKAEKYDDRFVNDAVETTITNGGCLDTIKTNPAQPVPTNTALISYKGVITRCLLPEAGVYVLDDRLMLYLTHSNLSNLGRGLREGAEVEISNAHVLKISTQHCKHMSGFFCCPLGRIEVLHFSKKDTSFMAYVPRNKLSHMLSCFSAMDVAWLTIVFLSLLEKLKKKRLAFGVLAEVCERVGVASIQQNVHSTFLQVPHCCPFLESVDLSHRPLAPTLEDILRFSKEQTASSVFIWRGGKAGGVGANSSSVTAPNLSVAVSATWSFGMIRSTDFPNAQLLIGTVQGNKRTGNLELVDNTAAIPLIGCVPYGQPTTVSDSNGPSSWLLDVKDGSMVALGEFTVIVERTEETERNKKDSLAFYIHSQEVKVLTGENPRLNQEQGSSSGGHKDKKSTSVPPRALYVFIKHKNALRSHGPVTPNSSHCSFEAQALAHSSCETLQSFLADNTLPPTAVDVALVFTSARCYAYLHNKCTYRICCPEDSREKLPSLSALSKDPCVTVSDGFLLEMVALPSVPVRRQPVQHCNDRVLEIGELVSSLYLPKLQTAFATQREQGPRSKEGVVSFRGLIMEHSYRIDCDTTHQTPWQPATSSAVSVGSLATRHIIALSVRGTHCPNTVMVYCKYKPREILPLGLLPGTVATFHNFSLNSSARLGNIYCANESSSSISIESLYRVGSGLMEVVGNQNKSYGPTQEMLRLPISHLYELTQRLFRGCLSREVVRVRATVVSVQHAFIQFQCQTCRCTMVDGSCRQTCLSKRATLSTDARILVQDGTGEAHLYVKDRVLPTALGMTDREWSDLLDLIYKVGQVTYTKSSMYKGERTSRAVTIREKAESLFLDALTRPSLVRTRTIYCQPFISSSERQAVLGQKSYRVWVRRGTEYVTLSLPRFQLRALALAPTQPLTLSHKLLSLLEPP